MPRFFKYTTTALMMLSFIGVISASEPKQRDPEKTKILEAHALIVDDFSGIESTVIVKAFYNWISTTEGDVMILPPDERDGMYFDLIMKGDSKDMQVFEMDLESDGKIPDPWSAGCRHTFYVLRITSAHPVVRSLDKEDRQIMAFTFTGCAYKFIAVVADRMRDENLMYTTMLHELGHMWGLKDNREGEKSIMNGSWPGAPCITKRDVREVYDLHGKHNMQPKDAGCEVKKKD